VINQIASETNGLGQPTSHTTGKTWPTS